MHKTVGLFRKELPKSTSWLFCHCTGGLAWGGKKFGFGYHLGTVDTHGSGVSLATALCGRFFQSFLVAGKNNHCLYTHWIILDLNGLSVLVSGNLEKIPHPVTEQDTSALKNTLQFQGQSSRQVQNWPPTWQKLMHLTVQALLSQMFHRPVAAYPIKMAASVLNSFCPSAEITASNLMHPSIVPPLTLLHELRNCTHFSWSLIGHSRLVCTRANFTVQCSTYCWDKTERTRKLFHK